MVGQVTLSQTIFWQLGPQFPLGFVLIAVLCVAGNILLLEDTGCAHNPAYCCPFARLFVVSFLHPHKSLHSRTKRRIVNSHLTHQALIICCHFPIRIRRIPYSIKPSSPRRKRIINNDWEKKRNGKQDVDTLIE